MTTYTKVRGFAPGTAPGYFNKKATKTQKNPSTVDIQVRIPLHINIETAYAMAADFYEDWNMFADNRKRGAARAAIRHACRVSIDGSAFTSYNVVTATRGRMLSAGDCKTLRGAVDTRSACPCNIEEHAKRTDT